MIKIKKIFFVLFSLILLFSCRKEQNNNNNNSFRDSMKVELKDTIRNRIDSIDNNPSVSRVMFVRDTEVLFFLPAPKQRQELVKFYGMYDQYRFRDIFSNFIDLSNTAKNVLRKRGIPVKITYSKRFIFPLDSDTVVYDVNLEDQIMGYILADGQNPPLIKNGVSKRNQLSKDLRNYFNLSNFKISD